MSCNEFCNKYRNNFCNLPVFIIVILLLLLCKDKDNLFGCYEKRPKLKGCKLGKHCKPCKPCKPCKEYEPEYIGKCIEDMLWDEPKNDYNHKDYNKCNNKKHYAKKNDNKNFDNLMKNFSINDLEIDDQTMKQASELMKHLFK